MRAITGPTTCEMPGDSALVGWRKQITVLGLRSLPRTGVDRKESEEAFVLPADVMRFCLFLSRCACYSASPVTRRA